MLGPNVKFRADSAGLVYRSPSQCQRQCKYIPLNLRKECDPRWRTMNNNVVWGATCFVPRRAFHGQKVRAPTLKAESGYSKLLCEPLFLVSLDNSVLRIASYYSSPMGLSGRHDIFACLAEWLVWFIRVFFCPHHRWLAILDFGIKMVP
jgi:hypothetical protein